MSKQKVLLICASLLVLAGCARGCTSRKPPIHLNPNMDNQPVYRPQAASAYFRNGAVMQSPVEGTIARGALDRPSEFLSGRTPAGAYISNPLPADDQVLARGEERFNIYCAPCHGGRGDGQGVLFTRSGVRSASFFDERLIQMPDGQLFEAMSVGVGLMPGYGHQVSAEDRWAIVAYVRALQARQPQQ